MVPGTTGRTTPGNSCWIARCHSTSPAYGESSPTIIPDRSNRLYILQDLPYGHCTAIAALNLVSVSAHVIKSYTSVPFPDASGMSGIVTETKMGVVIVDTHMTQKATKL